MMSYNLGMPRMEFEPRAMGFNHESKSIFLKAFAFNSTWLHVLILGCDPESVPYPCTYDTPMHLCYTPVSKTSPISMLYFCIYPIPWYLCSTHLCAIFCICVISLYLCHTCVSVLDTVPMSYTVSMLYLCTYDYPSLCHIPCLCHIFASMPCPVSMIFLHVCHIFQLYHTLASIPYPCVCVIPCIYPTFKANPKLTGWYS